MTHIVDTTDELTPQWFTQVLRTSGALGAQDAVGWVDARVIGTGQAGFVARAHLGYAGGAAGPASLIVKLPSADASSRQMGAAMGIYESEVRFYQQVAPRLSAAIPAIYWGDVEPASGRFTLVLEDLQATSDVGDMVGGGTLTQAELAIGALPGLQAPIWNDPGLAELPWAGLARTELLFAAVEPLIEAFVARFHNRVDPTHLELAKRLSPAAAGSAQRLWGPPFVIAHGDYRLDNMMFARLGGAPPVSVIDWQGARLGPPLLDVAIYLGSCLGVDERRAHQDRLLHLYHDRLRAAGVDDFSFAQCQDSYRVSSLYPFLLTIAVSMTLQQTERGDQMWAQMFTNSASIVADTGADALLLS
ncbi:phosphotransferase enzyme family [Mycobacterium parascrofulaceum ATCC BAA-614]|uniref:Phosphotransferase enzyme family n=1 Tax=Mycobacterium parascrofulaceum ATCC BAA-614 TaxID=525368 RepID=D5P5R2_9MYCO|nr:phosphotransferase [Mycobacterium parascrofulaceum]EFG78591.1 phosphotransferase enzyme family [Mycobacterium parascrofulaceum ATCC BAA-614]